MGFWDDQHESGGRLGGWNVWNELVYIDFWTPPHGWIWFMHACIQLGQNYRYCAHLPPRTAATTHAIFAFEREMPKMLTREDSQFLSDSEGMVGCSRVLPDFAAVAGGRVLLRAALYFSNLAIAGYSRFSFMEPYQWCCFAGVDESGWDQVRGGSGGDGFLPWQQRQCISPVVATDFADVYCDSRGNDLLYVGLVSLDLVRMMDLVPSCRRIQ
ncbi:hypothetical protein ACLOJK_022753 [Asimina triloba]